MQIRVAWKMYEIRVACLEKHVFGDICITTVGYSRKKKMNKGEGDEDMEFSGVAKK